MLKITHEDVILCAFVNVLKASIMQCNERRNTITAHHTSCAVWPEVFIHCKINPVSIFKMEEMVWIETRTRIHHFYLVAKVLEKSQYFHFL